MNSNDLDQLSQLLDQKLDEKLEPIKKTLDEHGKMLHEHGKLLNEHGEILHEHGKILNKHGKLLKSLKKDQDTMLHMLDREQMNQNKRLKRIENTLKITSTIS